jgi:hypothetical protein
MILIVLNEREMETGLHKIKKASESEKDSFAMKLYGFDDGFGIIKFKAQGGAAACGSAVQ